MQSRRPDSNRYNDDESEFRERKRNINEKLNNPRTGSSSAQQPNYSRPSGLTSIPSTNTRTPTQITINNSSQSSSKQPRDYYHDELPFSMPYGDDENQSDARYSDDEKPNDKLKKNLHYQLLTLK